MADAPWQQQIAEALSVHAAGRRRHRPAVVDPVDQLTFGQLHERARRIAGTLTEHPDAARRHLVVLQAASRTSFLAAVFGVMLSGHAPLPVPSRALRETREHLWLQLDLPTGPARCRPWIATVSAHTGQRSIWITHGEPPSSPRKALALGMQPDGISLLASPLYLAGPLEYATRQILLGGTVVLAAPFHPTGWIRAARTWRPTWVFAVPTQLQRLLDEDSRGALSDAFASVDRLVHSSQPCPTELRQRLLALLGPERLREYYGTIQYDGTIATPPSDSGLSAGRPITGTELRVVDDRGAPIPAGLIGAIEGRSTAGVVSHALEEPCPSPGSWRRAGDHGRLTDDGLLEVTSVVVPGRAIVGGVKVSLEHVRDIVEQHPLVAGCIVTAPRDARYGQVIAVQVTAADPALTAHDVAAHCGRSLEAAERPRHITIDPAQPCIAQPGAVTA